MRISRGLIEGRARMGEIEEGLFHPLADDIFAAVERTGEAVPLADVALLSPLAPEMVLLMIGAFKAPGEVRAPDAVPWMMPKLTSRLGGGHRRGLRRARAGRAGAAG